MANSPMATPPSVRLDSFTWDDPNYRDYGAWYVIPAIVVAILMAFVASITFVVTWRNRPPAGVAPDPPSPDPEPPMASDQYEDEDDN